MKKKVIGLTIAGIVALSGVVSAASMWGTYKGNDIVRVTINGSPARISDVPAINYNSRTMVPISMLTQFGVDYTWDGSNKTVDVKGYSYKDFDGKVDGGKIKAYSRVTNMYYDLESVGEAISRLSNTMSITYQGVQLGHNIFDDTLKKLNGTIQMYNNVRDRSNATLAELSYYEIDSDAVNEILNNYYSALDYFKKSYSGLESYSTNKTTTNFDTYLNNSSSGFDKSYDGIELAGKNYTYWYTKVQNS